MSIKQEIIDLIDFSIHVKKGIASYINMRAYEHIEITNGELTQRFIEGSHSFFDRYKPQPLEIEIIVTGGFKTIAQDEERFFNQVNDIINKYKKTSIMFVRLFPVDEIKKRILMSKYRCRLFFIPNEYISNFRGLDETDLENSSM